MKHASQEALDQLGELLEELRSTAGLIEKKRGVFDRKGGFHRSAQRIL